MKRRWRRIKIIGGVAFGCVVLVYLAAARFGVGGRTFFSPDTLESRAQGECLLPLTEIPVCRGRAATYRMAVVNFLIARGFWSKSDVTPPRWICVSHHNAQWRDGQSQFHRELAWRGEDWIRWSQENDALARVVWPRVLRELRKPGVTDTGDAQRILTAARIAWSVESFEWLTSESIAAAR